MGDVVHAEDGNDDNTKNDDDDDDHDEDEDDDEDDSAVACRLDDAVGGVVVLRGAVGDVVHEEAHDGHAGRQLRDPAPTVKKNGHKMAKKWSKMVKIVQDGGWAHDGHAGSELRDPEGRRWSK